MPAAAMTRLMNGQSFLRPGIFAGGIALIVTLLTGIFAEQQNRAVHLQSARAHVGEELGLVRAKLEGNITSNIQLVRGLVAVITTQPDIDQQQFSRIAANLIGNHSQLRNIAGAPGMVISLMYPIKGNEQAIGLDYLKNEKQREAALRAVASHELVLAGPVDLLQGGQGFIGRFPVFVDDGRGGKRLWGIVSAVVDVDRLYTDSGLQAADLPIEIGLAGRDATGSDGAVFFGRPGLFDDNPVVSDIALPSGSWQIAAVPRDGWPETPANTWQLRILIALAGLLVVVPISIAGFLYDQRRAHIRELEAAREEMEWNSLHDSLTSLPNRRFLDKVLLRGHGGRAVVALLHIDLDRFKQINDTLGHAAGDAMLVHAASVLSACTRGSDFIARVGGDEFVIAITSETGEDRLSGLASRIIARMRQPVPYQNHQCRFGVSIGIAIADSSETYCGKRLLIDADIALYRAKSDGRNRYEIFTASLKAEIIRTKRIADDILNGLERSEFLPYFQLQFDARTLDIAGVEALARWQHPTEGILTPDVFLKTADELNVVPLIDRIILEQTLWQSTRWKAAGISIPKMSVNVSAGRLYDADLIDSLDGIAIEPGTLSFELLESIFLDENNETIVANITQLKTLGIDIEIDDFGTGYASIISLLHVRPARLKIDRQLIAPIVGSDSQRRLVASIIDIGQSLGIKVVAEGVETMEHVAILRELGCDTLQGYALATPMSAEKLMEFVREESWRKVA